MTRRRVFMTDTTLRDGEQGCGFALGADGKARMARLLDDAGFCVIEAGIPAMGSCEKDAVCRIMDARKSAKIAAWNRMRKEDIRQSFDCGPDIIHISAPASDAMIEGVLKKDRAWVLKTLKNCAAYARENGYEVTVGFQDASRADIEFMAMLANEMMPLGVTMVRLADTAGILHPASARRLIEGMTGRTDMSLSVHTHNDLGMAMAVAAEAVKGGVSFVDTTLFGIGERAGNCDSYRFASWAGDAFDIAPAYADIMKLRGAAESILFPNGGKTDWP
jgi:homocitrate synthase NifV